MKKWRGLALFLVVLMILEGFSVMASSSPVTDLAKFTDEVAKRYIGTEDPWALISLTQLGYRHANVKALEKKLRETVAPGTASSSGAAEGHGVAEYAKAIMGLASLGKNAKKEATAMLAIENITYAGDAANALLALDAIGYKTGKKNLWDREKLINMLLNQQVIMGGWGYYGVFDIDTTAMVLSALKRYTDRDGVTEAINLAVKRLSSAQEKDGGFISFGVVNSVSEAQAVVALSTLGIDAGADPQFVKDASLMSHFLSYRTEDNYFAFIGNDESNLMATENGLRALVAYKMYKEGRGGLYDLRGFRKSWWEKFLALFKKESPSSTADSSDMGEAVGAVTLTVGGTIIANKSVDIYQDDTVIDVLLRVASADGVSVKCKGFGPSASVNDISGVKAGPYGSKSGWTYKIDGKDVYQGPGARKVQTGDVIVWTYVK